MDKSIILQNTKAPFDQEILIKLRNRDYSVRKDALKIVEETGNIEYFTEVIRLLNDKNEIIRADAVQTLFFLSKEKSLKYLIEKLDDKHRFVRSAAATFIGEVGDKSAIKDLENALCRERSNTAKVGILEGLYLLGQRKRLHELLLLLKSKKYQVRCAVVETVKYLILEDADRKYVITKFETALKNEPTIAVQSSIKAALKQLKEEPWRNIKRDPPRFL
jgi:HEAT repeat protein